MWSNLDKNSPTVPQPKPVVKIETTNFNPNSNSIGSDNKPSGSDKKKEGSKSPKRKIKKLSDVEKALNKLWKRKDEYGITWIVALACSKSVNVIKRSKREKPFPIKRASLLVGIYKIMQGGI